jgi:prophage regulatory protein
MAPAANDNAILISLRDVCALTSLSRTMINRLRGVSDFPAEVAMGERRIAFVREEVVAWIDARVQARETRRAA